jgi:hypothetical protein
MGILTEISLKNDPELSDPAMIQAAKQPKTDALTPWIKQHSQGTQDNAIALTKTRQMHYHACTRPSTPEITMPATLEAESTLTDRYQTTVPETVRRALRLRKRDKIQYVTRQTTGINYSARPNS